MYERSCSCWLAVISAITLRWCWPVCLPRSSWKSSCHGTSRRFITYVQRWLLPTAMKAMAMMPVFIAEFLSQAVANVLTRR